MQENDYIQVLIQSLHQKVEALDSITEKNEEQYAILSETKVDMDAFEKNVADKSEYVDKIIFLDEGFDEIFSRVKEILDTDRQAYQEDIRQMKKLISAITERSMKVQAQEQRNKQMADRQFSQAKSKIRQLNKGNRIATQYYQNMQQLGVIDPQFMDKKK